MNNLARNVGIGVLVLAGLFVLFIPLCMLAGNNADAVWRGAYIWGRSLQVVGYGVQSLGLALLIAVAAYACFYRAWYHNWP